MAGNKAAIRSRIKSVNTTKKITGAMELISTVKLQKYRNIVGNIITFEDTIEDIVSKIQSSGNDLDNAYVKKNNASKRFFFIFTSDMGLCGGYNLNIEKLISNNVNKDDLIILVGSKLYKQMKDEGYKIINDLLYSDKLEYNELNKLSKQAINMFRQGEINSINVIYTKFVNNISFKPNIKKVLPYESTAHKQRHQEMLFEPSPDEVLNELMPIYIENNIYRLFIESKTSEHGSRRYAMENATNNADELNEKLLLAYNQARQAAITSEITEIVAGADAL